MAEGPARRDGSGASWPDAVPGTRFREVRAFAELDSTNRYLLGEARAGAAEGLVVVADFQTGGRGRLGRTWTAPPGSSLLVSVLLRPALRAEHLHRTTIATALAVVDALEAVAGLAPALKWPNDVLVEGRKLAGVLAEADLGAGSEVRAVVVGVGVNVDWPRLPDELAATATACNLAAGREVDRAALLSAFLTDLDARLDAPPQVLLADYRAHLATLGARVRVDREREAIAGVAVDVDDTGALLVETGPGSVVAISAGDVVHLRPE